MERHEPIVISGCGWITPYAAGSIDDVLTAARPEPMCADGFWAIGEELLDAPGAVEIEGTPELKQDRGAKLAAQVLHLARSDAGTPSDWDGTGIGLVLGCGLAGQMGMLQFANEVRAQSPRFVSPIHFPQTVGNYIAGALSRAFDLRGPNVTLAGGMGSGLDAVAEAARILRAGEADVMVAGGVEVLSPDLARTFEDGSLPLAEGACFFMVERESRAKRRNQPVLATICPEVPPDQETRKPEIISSARHDLKNAVTIASWIGCCYGTLGAAAIAAAIGAARGIGVPEDGGVDPIVMSDAAQSHLVRVVAEAHNVSLCLNVP